MLLSQRPKCNTNQPMKSIIVIVLSFLLMSSCNTFEENVNEMATFTIAVPGGSIQLSGNPIIINATTTTTGKTSHQLLCRVTCTDGAIPGGPWIDSIAPKNGAASFNISGLVDTVFNYEFDIESNVIFLNHPLLAANLEVKIGETYTNTDGLLIEEWDTSTPFDLTVLKGALELPQLTTLSSNNSSFNSEYIQAFRFLSQINNYNVQKIKISDINDWVKCWMYIIEDGFYLRPSITFFYSDGTTSTSEVEGISSETGLWEINIHKAATTYATSGKTVDKYIFEGCGYISVDIDNLYYENHDELLILNRFGAVEDLHCYGEATDSINIGSETYTKPLPQSPTVFDATLFSEGKEGEQTFKINTGFKTKQERLWIKDLLLYKKKQAWLKSEKLPWLTNKTFGICPVIIKTTSAEIDTTGEDVKSIDIEVQLAH